LNGDVAVGREPAPLGKRLSALEVVKKIGDELSMHVEAGLAVQLDRVDALIRSIHASIGPTHVVQGAQLSIG